MYLPMELSEKPQARKPRIQHGPHRLRQSGVVACPDVPTEYVAPTLVIGDSEIVSSAVDIMEEIVPLSDAT